VVGVQALLSPPLHFFCLFLCLLSRITLLNVLCEKARFHDAEITYPGRDLMVNY